VIAGIHGNIFRIEIVIIQRENAAATGRERVGEICIVELQRTHGVIGVERNRAVGGNRAAEDGAQGIRKAGIIGHHAGIPVGGVAPNSAKRRRPRTGQIHQNDIQRDKTVGGPGAAKIKVQAQLVGADRKVSRTPSQRSVANEVVGPRGGPGIGGSRLE